MTRIQAAEVVEGITDEALDELIRRFGWTQSRRVTGHKKETDPPIVFNAFDFSQPNAGRGQGCGNLFHGGGAWTLRDRQSVRERDGLVCQTAYELHSVRGCLFKCDYCYFENVLNIMLNLEEMCEHLVQMVSSADQTLWKYDNGSDILAFEPEYGASEVLVRWFGTQRRGFLMHYTKSDNVDVLRGLPHNGQTIVCWSLSAKTQSQVIEGETADWRARIEAGRKCHQWGYAVRYRLSPIVPVRNWREQNRSLIERLFSRVNPDVLTLQILSRFPDYEMLSRTLDVDLLDPDFLAAAYRAKNEMAGNIVGPFPHDKRLEVYRFMIETIREHSPDVPLTICLETPDMWESLRDCLRLDTRLYPCCCGPYSTPGGGLLGSR